jgi:hypothetical protein
METGRYFSGLQIDFSLYFLSSPGTFRSHGWGKNKKETKNRSLSLKIVSSVQSPSRDVILFIKFHRTGFLATQKHTVDEN